MPARCRTCRSVDLDFDNSFVRELPGDPLLPTCRARCAIAHRVAPTPVASPRWSRGVAVGSVGCRGRQPAVAEVLGSNRVLPGMQPYAAEADINSVVVRTLGDGAPLRSPKW
jgi:hypothetical protein